MPLQGILLLAFIPGYYIRRESANTGFKRNKITPFW